MGDDVRGRREAVVYQHMEAENEHRWDDVMATFAPGRARYELIASGEVFEGEEEVREYWRSGRAMIPDQRNELIALHHADDAVITEFWLRGTHSGGPRPSGRSFEARMVAVFEFEGERIVCERVYWDRETIVGQLQGK
ncbi:MAG: ester cyclase [Acidimicrobiales bacterium]